MVHDQPGSPLPEDWREQVGRAYLAFGVESFLEPQDTELGIGSFLRGAQRYWTTARRSAKAKKQLRDPESKEWVEQRGGLPGRQARADIDDDVDALRLPEGKEPRFHFPEINPGLAKAARNTKLAEGGVVKQEIPVPAPSAMVVPSDLLEQINVIRAEQGLEPLMGADGTWVNNGADWRALSPAARREMLDLLREKQDFDPRAAGSIEEMTANIIDAFRSASPQEVGYGEKWYEKAAEETANLALEYGVDPHFVAALVASTSPRTEWSANLAAARIVLESMLPEKSPKITNDFLNTRMTFDTELDGKTKLPLNPDGTFAKQPPNGWDYVLADDEVRKSFQKRSPKRAGETDEAYKQRITDTIVETLKATNPDGTPLQLYQFRDQKLRGALMNVNNRVLGEKQVLPEGVERRPGMGLQIPTYTADGHLQYNRLAGYPGLLSSNVATVDRLFGYDTLDQDLKHLPQGWGGMPVDEVDLYHRINETLGGHKTRSFYNNIITGGKSDFATIDVHALRAALLGKGATRSGASVPGAEKLLENPKYPKLPALPKDATPEQKAERKAINAARAADYQRWKDEQRIGVYAAVNEAFRQAADQINVGRAEQGLPPLTPAQVQAVAWVASRSESVAADFSNMAMEERDPARVADRVLLELPAAQRRRALEIIAMSRSLTDAQRNFAIAGFDPNSLSNSTFRRAKMAGKAMVDEFNEVKRPGTMNLTKEKLATAAWLLSRNAADEDAARRMREMFADKKGMQPNFTPADAAMLRRMLADRYTKDEILAGAGGDGIQARLDAYNERRRLNGVDADPFTYDEFLQYLREGDYV